MNDSRDCVCYGESRDCVCYVMVIQVIVCVFCEGDPGEGEGNHEPSLPDTGQ